MPGIRFEEEGHKYFNQEGERYTSVTTLIHEYTGGFDEHFWSHYKAAQRMIEGPEPEKWRDWKMGYLKSGDKGAFLAKALSLPGIEGQRRALIKEWRANNKRATDYGSAFHDSQEAKYRKAYNSPQVQGRDIAYPALLPENHEGNGVHLELYVYHHGLRLAGAIDRARVFSNGEFEIVDFKSNKALKFDTWQNPWTGHKDMMKAPLGHLPDCNYSHYTMQLSLYAWMLEQLGYRCRMLKILHIVPVNIEVPHTGREEADTGQRFFKRVPYVVRYRKEEVEAMLEDWKCRKSP